MIRPATADDAEIIARIYNHFILATTISFEEQPVTAGEMAERMAGIASAGLPWLVIEEAGAVMGYAYATKWRVRQAYRFSVECSVYLDPGASGRGLGARLYEALLARLREQKVHVAIGGIALPNAASIALHESFGFQKVAQFSEVGFKFDRWIDMGYWQLTL